MTIPAFSLCDVEHFFDGEKRLSIPRLEVFSGSLTALVGPNGAGKTTLLHILALLAKPTRGHLVFCGQPVSYVPAELHALRQRITLVMQNPFIFHTTVEANVAYGLSVRGADRRGRKQRVGEVLETVGLAGYERRPARELSGGELRRVAIARALAIDPEVILFDEPMANVDREHVGVIEEVIGRLGSGKGKTVIFATHDVEQAYRLADHIICLIEGTASPFPLVNLFRGRVVVHQGVPYFDTGRIAVEVPVEKPEARFIAVDPEDIVLSRSPLHSSARNCFLGRIQRAQAEGNILQLTIECGEILVARITRRSYEELGLNVGEEVYLTFKSTAIHVH